MVYTDAAEFFWIVATVKVDSWLQYDWIAGQLPDSSIVTSSASFTLVTPAFDVVFIAAAVALHTIGKFANALLHVLPANVVGRVFMAAVAGVAAVVIAHVASYATGIVVTVQHEVLVVIKGGWRPFLLGMALGTVARDLFVQGVAR